MEFIRVRVYLFDFNGQKSNRTEVRYVKSIDEAKKIGWKFEIA